MKTFNFQGYKTIVIKEGFDVKANTQAQAIEILKKKDENGELDGQWFNWNETDWNEISEPPDFYCSDSNEEWMETA